MAAAETWFAPAYDPARQAFLGEADQAGWRLHSLPHPLLGPTGQPLALDIARLGGMDAEAVLLLSSGCHGLEGVAGSALQRALIADAELRQRAADAGVALVLAHALNPWGYAWSRRTTQENVDLNRNFVDFRRPLPGNPAYDELAHAIVPGHWPPPPDATSALQAYAARHGQRALDAVITGGQYRHPQGLFYGGHDPTWSRQALHHLLQDHAGRCRHLGWIDVHTGLGPSGHGECIFAGRADDAAALARARRWWGPEVTALHEGSSSSAPLHGVCMFAAYDDCAQARYSGIALEFGTLPLAQVLDALRADQWLDNHPQTCAETATAIKQGLRAAFVVDDPGWRRAVLAQGMARVRQAIEGLAAELREA